MKTLSDKEIRKAIKLLKTSKVVGKQPDPLFMLIRVNSKNKPALHKLERQ